MSRAEAQLAARLAEQAAAGRARRRRTVSARAAGGVHVTVAARADVVETLGAEIFAHLACGRHTIVARMEVPEHALHVGDALTVNLRMAKTHVFDAETSATIV